MYSTLEDIPNEILRGIERRILGLKYKEKEAHNEVHDISTKGSFLKLLDAGRGERDIYYVEDTIEEGIDAYSINISSYALQNASDEVKDRIIFRSITQITFGDDEFDVMMTASDVIEHIHPKDALTMQEEIESVKT